MFWVSKYLGFLRYLIDPKSLDRQVWENSVDSKKQSDQGQNCKQFHLQPLEA